MKELLIGGNGLIGSYIPRDSSERKIVAPLQKELDITSWILTKKFFDRVRPDVVVHLAAQTGILKGEKERGNKKGLFWQVNVEGTKNIVENCLRYNSYLVFISAEVVFAGTKKRPGPYSENDTPEENQDHLSWYGWTKVEAERLIQKELPQASIVRLSSVVGRGEQPRPDYARKILQAYDGGQLPSMFVDQHIGLTDVDEFIIVLRKLVERRLSGIFHVASLDQFSPFEFANLLLEKTRGVKRMVKPGLIEDYLKKHPATFPQYSGLKTEKTQELLGVRFSSWKRIVDKIAPEIRQS